MMQTHTRSTTLCALLAFSIAGGCSDFSTEPNRTPAEIRVVPDTILLMTGDTAEFQVELIDESGDVYESIPAWSPPLWTSERPDRISIDDGVIMPTRGGENRLQVALAGVQGAAVIRANPAELGVSVVMAYVTQSVQRTDGDVPLVAGRPGLLRVVVVGDDENFYRPRVLARFYDGDAVIHEAVMELEEEGLPTRLQEGDAELSYDVDVPADVLYPGVGLALVIDPDRTVPAASGSELRVPATGVADLDIQEVPPFRLMMVPVTLASHGGIESGLDPEYANQVFQFAWDLFPFAEVDLQVREPYTTEARMDTEGGWTQLLYEIRALRETDGNPHYYYGGFRRPSGTNIAGLGFVGRPVAIGMESSRDVIAHELGHTLNLPHAPCGGPASPDPDFPHPGGIIGSYGYNRSLEAVLNPDRYDLMTYCDPVWISDYNYENVLSYRETSPYDAALSSGGAAARSQSPRVPILLVQGGVHGGQLHLEPALRWSGRVIMPDGGRYTLEGLDPDGDILFSLNLEPDPLDHGGSQFMVAIPESTAQPDRLARLRLRGPEGQVERGRGAQPGAASDAPAVQLERRANMAGAGVTHAAHWDTDLYALAVVRDRQTGRIRAMARDGTVVIPDGDETRYQVILSDGVSSRAARVVER